MLPKSFIDCDDYNVGDFIPISFSPKLKWVITESEFVEHPVNKLPKSIHIESECFGGTCIVASHPYSYGRFYLTHRYLDISDRLLHTNDPEEAVYLSELFLRRLATKYVSFYDTIVRKLS